MSYYTAGGDGGGREHAGEKGFAGSRKAKRDQKDDDWDETPRKDDAWDGVPQKVPTLPQFLICPCCERFLPKDTLRECLLHGRDIGECGFTKVGDDYYHTQCVCSLCGEPGEPDINIFFETQGAHVSTRIPYKCQCMENLPVEVKMRLFSDNGDPNSLIRPPVLSLMQQASQDELIDYFRIWGEYFGPRVLQDYERLWASKTCAWATPKENQRTVRDIIEELNEPVMLKPAKER
jgi:hypothetical protein